jgi:hypothetical protein
MKGWTAMSKGTSEAARKMARARWKGATAAQRKEHMTEIGKRGGRPREERRCFCGHASMWTISIAAARPA